MKFTKAPQIEVIDLQRNYLGCIGKTAEIFRDIPALIPISNKEKLDEAMARLSEIRRLLDEAFSLMVCGRRVEFPILDSDWRARGVRGED